MKIFHILFILLLLVACSQKPIESNQLIVDESTVVFLFPDSMEMKLKEQSQSQDEYSNYVTDLAWQPAIAYHQLDSLKIPSMNSNNEYIVFEKNGKEITRVKRSEVEGNMIAFNKHTGKILVTNTLDFELKRIESFFREK